MRLEGRSALVTGGASGIGAATARRLSAEGASVAVADIHEEGARDVAGELDGVALTMDVTDLDSIRAAVAAAVEALGPLDVLVNNAGGGGGFAPVFFVDTEEAEWDNTLALNLRSVMAVTHTVLPAMQGRGRGAIVNVASEAGRVGSQLSVSYSAAKAGVIGLTKSLGKELALTGIRVNCITPAVIETEILQQMSREHIAYMLSRIPMGRPGTVEEVAGLVAWLCSEECSFTTGAVFDISGGRATY